MTKVVYEVKNENQLRKVIEKLEDAKLDYKSWTEQPENILTAIATKPYRREDVGDAFKKCQLFR